MKREVTISTKPIDETRLLATRQMSSGMGAVIYFLGVVRATEEGHGIEAIEYEAFGRMAEHQFNLLLDQIEQRWPNESVCLVHRRGRGLVSEPSLWIEVFATHRAEALAACQWSIHELNRVVTIW